MLFCLIHDVWANFVDNEEFGYNVPEFHEWRNNEKPELFAQIPLVLVEPLLFDHIENTLDDIPKDLLVAIQDKSFKQIKQQKIGKNYCFLATDGKRIIAIDTDGTTIPVRKSKIAPKTELLLFEVVEGFKPISIKFNINENLDIKNKFIGLTRREKTLMDILIKAVQPMKKRKNLAEVKYWIQEFNSNITNEELDNKEFDELFNKLNLEIKNWKKNHENVGVSLVKGKRTFEKQWNTEIKNSIGSKC